MKWRDIASVLMTLVVLVGSSDCTGGGAKSKLMDLFLGITRTSVDVVVSGIVRAREILPQSEIIYPDNTLIYELLEYLKDKMKYPHPSLELPILDPFKMNQADINITNDIIGERYLTTTLKITHLTGLPEICGQYIVRTTKTTQEKSQSKRQHSVLTVQRKFPDPIRLSVFLEDLQINKASKFEIRKVKMHWLTKALDLEVSFPLVDCKFKYGLKGVVGDILPVYGNGPATVSATNFNFSGTVYFGTRDFINIEKIELNYTVEAFQVNATNLMGGGRLGELLNIVLSEDAPRILDLVRTDLIDFGTNWLHSSVNYILGKLSLSYKDVLNFIKSVGTKKVQSLLSG